MREGDAEDHRRARPHLEHPRDPKEKERSVNFRPHQVQNADRYVENGITHLMIGVGGPDYDLSPLRELIAWRDEYRERNPEAAAS